MGYTLYLVTYARGTRLNTGINKPFHWSFFVQISQDDEKNLGYAYQLRGMPGAFYYAGPEEVDLNKSHARREELDIGDIDPAKLSLVHQHLSQCNIEAAESTDWNCQDWALQGLEMLRTEGFVYDGFTADVVRNWLREP
ncbi:MAG: hypothetical protein M1814_002046 [Vezdaea aestivalis]|nr:MAG: hypothetical protein M1814_002046 [Vezdaea aestivalis]